MTKRKTNIRPDESGFIDLKTGRPSEEGELPIICERVKFYRELRSISQARLAELLGVSANTIGHWEKGRNRPDISLVPKLCEIFRISPYILFGMGESGQDFTTKEINLIRKYRTLSAGHRHVVDKLAESLVLVEKTAHTPDLKELILFDRPLAAGVGDPTELEEEGSPIYL